MVDWGSYVGVEKVSMGRDGGYVPLNTQRIEWDEGIVGLGV